MDKKQKKQTMFLGDDDTKTILNAIKNNTSIRTLESEESFFCDITTPQTSVEYVYFPKHKKHIVILNGTVVAEQTLPKRIRKKTTDENKNIIEIQKQLKKFYNTIIPDTTLSVKVLSRKFSKGDRE